MKKGRSIVAVLAVLGAVGCFTLSIIASKAQGETVSAQQDPLVLQRKVEQLEKQVLALQKQIDALKQAQEGTKVTWSPSVVDVQMQGQVQTPPPGTPYRFNGKTYYWVLLDANGRASQITYDKRSVLFTVAPTP